jgi:septal ring factor EnvC (AmiA/AmiB activator)
MATLKARLPLHTTPSHLLSAVYKKQDLTKGVGMNRLTMILALAGWALYGFSVLGPQSAEADAQADIARLSQAAETASAGRDALAAELKRFKEEYQDLQHVQKQIAAAAQELKHLEYIRARVSGEIDAMHSERSEDLAQAAVPDETVSPEMSLTQPAESGVSP